MKAPPAIRQTAAAMTALTMAAAGAGPYPPAAGKPGSDAIAADDPRIRGWAEETTALARGPEEIDDPFSLAASYGSEASAIGRADVTGTQDQPEPGSPLTKPAVSLGDGGSITLRFDPPISDGPGPDFAVFENGISFNGGNSFFMELALVEVSSNGTVFVRFPAFSETPVAPQISAYAALDPTNVRNLAGKYMAGHGTPFDLAELIGTPGLETHSVTHVRILDVVGSVDPAYGHRDSLGRLINDPWPTFLTTSGFDLDAIGVLNQATAVYAAWHAGISWGTTASDPESDADGDGLSNLLEYALDLPPLHPQPATPVIVASTTEGWVATLPPVRPEARDVVVDAETSTDLRSWTPRTLAPQIWLGPADGGPAYIRLRVRVISPP